MVKERVLSGIQATGDLHLGNYLGAITKWVDLQNQNLYDCFFFIADLHAITVQRPAAELHKARIEVAAAFVACGLDDSKSTLFVQSHVPYHSELAWILNCVTPMGWLHRMTQFKDKAGSDREMANVGLFTYPVLQAADVLLYNPKFVPVGEDQKQHLELVRDIAGVVNRKFGYDLFTLPEPLIQKETARIKSLKDGMKKMSKSDPSDQSRINLSDTREMIYNKIKKSKTDSLDYISYDIDNRPEVSNLLNIYSELAQRPIDSIISEYEGFGFAKFKENLANLVCDIVGPITERYNYALQYQDSLTEILKKGADKATATSYEVLRNVKQGFGFDT